MSGVMGQFMDMMNEMQLGSQLGTQQPQADRMLRTLQSAFKRQSVDFCQGVQAEHTVDGDGGAGSASS